METETADIQQDSPEISRVNLEGQSSEPQPVLQPESHPQSELLSDAEYQEAFFQRLSAIVEREKALGSSIIVGLPAEEGDDEEEDDNDEDGDDTKGGKKVYSKEKIDALRYVIINKNRAAMLDKAMDMATCGQDGCIMFNTHTGNMVIDGITRFLKNAKDKKTPALRFDALLALTIAINEYPYWANDNEYWGKGNELDTVMKNLGKYWSTILSHSNEELGIDSEFTRPGVEALLAAFKDNIDEPLTNSGCSPFTYNLNEPKRASGGKKRKATAADVPGNDAKA